LAESRFFSLCSMGVKGKRDEKKERGMEREERKVGGCERSIFLFFSMFLLLFLNIISGVDATANRLTHWTNKCTRCYD
jgi:hypothetical protein